MSIADFLTDGGYLPGYSDQVLGNPVVTPIKEKRGNLWEQLCSDQRWRYEQGTMNDLLCGREGDRASDDHWGEKSTWKAVPAPVDAHSGSVAPRFVWEATPTRVNNETAKTYQERLICVLAGRFVCLTNNDNGVPQVAERYSWRYWDNEGNVYQDIAIKWTSYQAGDGDDAGGVPGEFGVQALWMFNEGHVHREFWDAVWMLKYYEGGTGSIDWDKALKMLASEVGVPDTPHWPLNENGLDTLAVEKGWNKITCEQPAMASYRLGDKRINFYLSTGTVGTCLDHPTQNKTQLFRRGIDMKGASTLFDNPREHTGRGYKKRKADYEPLWRRCAVCDGDKPKSGFSKNQQRKGRKSAKCTECAQDGRR